MPESPKVLSIVWNLMRGGTEGQCARLALALARHGHKHAVAVFRREGFFLADVERACGPVYHLDVRRMLSSRSLAQVRDLARHIHGQRFDLVHAWDCDASIFGSLAAMAANVPIVTSRRDLGQIYPAYKRWLMHRADVQSAAVTVNAAAIADGLRTAGISDDKIVRVTNILDMAEFDRLAAEPFSAAARLPTGPLVAMVSRLDPEKDGATFVRAAQRVRGRFPEAGFVVAGDGVERKQLEDQARDAGLDGHMVFLGDVTDVPALLRRCAIGLLVPSRNEGLSNTILEYMAAGVPVVATDCGGNKDLVVDGVNGFVVKPGDAEAVGDAACRLLGDPALCRDLGRAGRERVVKENGEVRVMAQFLDVYARAAAPGK
ncbi:MAG TPA: glycosyltransferase [Kiritimatiellia bacterium]|jgi:glycosyltransferase involved in cell wall biosynthesis